MAFFMRIKTDTEPYSTLPNLTHFYPILPIHMSHLYHAINARKLHTQFNLFLILKSFIMKNLILFTIVFILLITQNIFAQNVTYSNPWHYVNSPYGHVQIGPANGSGAHIYTNMSKFFFNKPVWAITGEFSAYSDRNLKLQTAGTTRMTILRSNGNVGVGRTNPLQKLDVAGNIKLGNGADAYLQNTTGYIGIRPADATHGLILRDYTGQGYSWSGMRHVDAPNVDRLEFAVLNSNSYGKSLVVTQNERVGVGTKYPQYKLHVTEAAQINATFIGGNPGGGGFRDGVTGLESLHLNAAKSGGVGGSIVFLSAGSTKMKLNANGQLLINTTSAPSTYKLGINGKIICEGMTVKLKSQWADYVFDEDYDLMSLENVEAHIKDNKHLPGIPSAKEVAEKGLDIETMQVKMMEKIEELTLYIIEQDKQIKAQQTQINKLMKDK